MTQETFRKILQIIASKDTSADPEGWTQENPLWGHCVVVSLLAQDYFGGKLFKGLIEGNSKYEHLHSHFWNNLPVGEVDFTAEQYPDLKFSDLSKEPRERERVLSHPDAKKRYNLLRNRFEIIAKEIL